MVSQVTAGTLSSASQHPLYKTAWCKNFEEHGSCPYQDACIFAHSPDEKRDSPRAMNEQSAPTPGPMTIDMGSLFSSARRVKGVKKGMSGSSAQLTGKVSRDIPTSQTGSTQYGDNTDKQSVASQPVEQAPRVVAAGRPQPSWSKAQRAEASFRGHARVLGSPAHPVNPATDSDDNQLESSHIGDDQADPGKHQPASSVRRGPGQELSNGRSAMPLAVPSASSQFSNPPPGLAQPSSPLRPPSQKLSTLQPPNDRALHLPPPAPMSQMLPTPQPVQHNAGTPPPPLSPQQQAVPASLMGHAHPLPSTPFSQKQLAPQAAQGIAAPAISSPPDLEHLMSQPSPAIDAPPKLTTATPALTALPHIAMHPSGADAGVHPHPPDSLPPMPAQQLLSPKPTSQVLPAAHQSSPAGPLPSEASSQPSLPSQLPQLTMMSQTIRSQQELAQTLERTNQKLAQDNQKLEKDNQTLKKANQTLQEEKQGLEKDSQHQKQGLQRLLSDKRRLQDILKAVRLPQIFLLDIDDGYLEEDWEAAVIHKLQAAKAYASSQQAIAHLVINHGGKDGEQSAAIRILCDANQKHSSVATASLGFDDDSSGNAGILAVIFPSNQ